MTTRTAKTYEIVTGTRSNPGRIVQTFKTATSCLEWYRRHATGQMFFRCVH